jgi:hypothetical protein
VPGVLFGQDEDGHHGNFHPLAYQKICSNPHGPDGLARPILGSKDPEYARIGSGKSWTVPIAPMHCS